MSSHAAESAKSDKTLVDLLRLQLAELEMLTSMYPNESEFRVDDPSAIPDILDFCEGQRQVMPQRLDFTINLQVEKVTLELYCSLPHDYPEADPEVYVRASGLDREQQHELNIDMSAFLQGLPEGELRVLVLIQWLSENGAKYINASKRKPEGEENGRPSSGSDPEDCDMSFSRLWIYSHHIYNKAKRNTILKTGSDLRLTGFCLPGKPGIICVEGYTKDCNRFWEMIRVMNWKRIMLKKQETFKPDDNVAEPPASNHNNNANCSLDDWRKFEPLQEVHFKSSQVNRREFHMNMGEFFKFLDNHHCGYVFKDYFGVDGKLKNPNGHS